jgi:hypothetical protein
MCDDLLRGLRLQVAKEGDERGKQTEKKKEKEKKRKEKGREQSSRAETAWR